MTTKGLSRKQVIIPINNRNKLKFISSLSTYIVNINSMLRTIKSNIIVDFVHMEQQSIVITMNKVTSPLNVQTIENYIKNIDQIQLSDVEAPQLPQSKFYLKMINIPYLMENTNMPINSSIVETILK